MWKKRYLEYLENLSLKHIEANLGLTYSFFEEVIELSEDMQFSKTDFLRILGLISRHQN